MPADFDYAPPVREPGPDRVWLHVVLFLLTLGTTTYVGAAHYLSFISHFGMRPVQFTSGTLWYGLWYSLSILGILGAHEMGHYFACRYYRIDATLPFFIPVPFVLTGTFGAVIRIRQPILRKAALFDIGIAGPIAGFVVAVPLLFYGMSISNVLPVPPTMEGMELGEPLLFKFASWVFWGHVSTPFSVNLHPVAFGAWFGLLATALNLFPIAQLDGGHISYAVFGRRSTQITFAALGVAVLLNIFSYSWLVWTLLAVAMLFVAGPRHPPVLDEDVPLDPVRTWLAVGALLMFIVCFTPAPIQPLDLLRH